MSEIVPFGKYKGQPVEVPATDRQYFEWLSGQAWFRDRYQNIYTLIVNNFTEPSETPEHNALQVRFLDDDFCRKLTRPDGITAIMQAARRVVKDWPSTKADLEGKISKNQERLPDGETNDWMLNHLRTETERLAIDLVKAALQLEQAEAFIENPAVEIKILQRVFETVRGWDVGFQADYESAFSGNRESYLIEIKPALGDDYPAVLRQMKARGDRYGAAGLLIIDKFTATGATFEQVKAIFKSSGFHVVTFGEIEAREP